MINDKEILNFIEKGDLNFIKSLKLNNLNLNRCYCPGETLINSKLNFFIKNPTLFIYSILFEKYELVEYFLLNKNLNIKIINNGWNALHFASFIEDFKCLKLLLQTDYFRSILIEPTENIDPFFPNEVNNCLHIAVSNSRYNNVKLLLNNFKDKINFFFLKNSNNNFNDIIDPNCISLSGNTSLHISIFKNDIKMTKILLSFGANPNIKNRENLNCIEYCQKLKNRENFIELFTNYNFIDIINEIEIENNLEPTITLNDLQNSINLLKQQINNLPLKIEEKPKKIIEQCHYCLKEQKFFCENCHFNFCENCFFKQIHYCLS